MMAAPYQPQPTAGPSRPYISQMPMPMPMPPPPPSKSPSSLADSSHAPWGNGYENGSQVPGGQEDRSESTKRNPLVDLIDTERSYVDQLGLVIRVSTSLPLIQLLHRHLDHESETARRPSCVNSIDDLSALQLRGLERTFHHPNSTPCFDV